MRAADVVVVVAGTDGALPAVVAGLVEAPVVAVPTSIGYGAALQARAAPLAAPAAGDACLPRVLHCARHCGFPMPL